MFLVRIWNHFSCHITENQRFFFHLVKRQEKSNFCQLSVQSSYFFGCYFFVWAAFLVAFRIHANIEHGSKTKTKPLARFASLFVPDFIFAHTHTHPSDYIFMVLWISMPRHQSLEKPLHMKMMRTNNNEQDTNTKKIRTGAYFPLSTLVFILSSHLWFCL